MRYSLVPQERDNYCVASVLQAIFRSEEIEISQSEISRNLTSCENKAFFVDDERINLFMSEMGLYYSCFDYNATPFNEPDMLLKEMSSNHGLVGVDNHAFLLEKFEDPVLILIDPKDGSIEGRNLYMVLKEMSNTNGIFGLVKKLDS